METNSNLEDAAAGDARAALAAIGSARSSAADRLVTPWWYHPILGLLAAVFVVVYTTGDIVAVLIVTVVYFAGLGILMGVYKEKTGMWINGLRAGRATWWTIPLVVIMVACMGGAYYLHAVHGLDWPAWVAGAIVFAAVNFFGLRFDIALRAQLRKTP
ncbi:hypothetical protein [Arthrobacter sp.]|uniref:hypothetical protein n=1 Tax=Arthrobacter sp. TaxID=1667 RepID=UPI0026E07FFF|nr:hypothetical protein [Arthrobacter sp.]MDO5751749.1 hypothetical protein [Arthrobacter sp.]